MTSTNKAIAALHDIQQALKAPKSLDNKYGGYAYRSAETILDAVKPLLVMKKAAIVMGDRIVEIGGRVYVESTATLLVDNDTANAVAYAREQDIKKGMDQSQITGSASSYARKYALCGLLAISAGEDADSHDNREEGRTSPKIAQKTTATAGLKKQGQRYFKEIETLIEANDSLGLLQLWEEMRRDLQEHVWNILTSEQKTQTRGLLDQARADIQAAKDRE